MPFTIDDVLQEVRDIAKVLQARDDVSEEVKHGLIDGVIVKGQKLRLNPTALLSFSVPVGSLPSDLRAKLQKALDMKVVGDSMQASEANAGDGTKPQKLTSIHCYPKQSQWDILQSKEASYIRKVQTLVELLKSLSITSLHEQTVKWCISLLVALRCESGGSLPNYSVIFEMIRDFKAAFSSTDTPSNLPRGLLTYPENPTELPKAIYDSVYTNEPPVKKDVERLAQIANFHVPLRSTSKLLTKERAKHAEQPNSTPAIAASSAVAGPDAMPAWMKDFVQAMQTAAVSEQVGKIARKPLGFDFRPSPRGAALALEDAPPAPSEAAGSHAAEPSPETELHQAAPSPGLAPGRAEAAPSPQSKAVPSPAAAADSALSRFAQESLSAEAYENAAFEALRERQDNRKRQRSKTKGDKAIEATTSGSAGGKAGKAAKATKIGKGKGKSKGKSSGSKGTGVAKKPASAKHEPTMAEARRFSSKDSYKSKYYHMTRNNALNAGFPLEQAKELASTAYKAAGVVWDKANA